MGNFKFGNISTKDFDLVIQAPPTYNFPQKDVTVEHIPGRNGDLLIDNNSWTNVERTYSVASVFRPGTDFISNSERLIKWLTSFKGYQRLEDSYDPTVYRLAEFKNNGSLTNYYDRATVLNVSFNCKPQRYLKNGEKPVIFENHKAILENPTGKTALPLVQIEGIENQTNDVLLLTSKNNNEVKSILSISKVPDGDVIIDSELQTVYSEDNGDINKYINLNNTNFPQLEEGITELSVDKYSESSGIVEKYSNLINNVAINNNTCFAKYKPYNAIVESKQKSVFVKSYDLLKQQVQEVYQAESYANYCLRKAESYTFISFNTVMDNACYTYTFQTDYSSAPSWLRITTENNKIVVYAADLSDIAGGNTDISSAKAWFISSGDKVVRLLQGDTDNLQNGWKIGEFAPSSTVTITVYPALASDGSLALNYDGYDIPGWLSFSISYDTSYSDSISGHTTWVLSSITYLAKETGYYYLPKSGLFGKAGWKHFTISGTSYEELTSLSWSSYKRKFMPSGISTSATASFEYHFLSQIPQYEPIMVEDLDENGNPKKDANGNIIYKESAKVHFIISSPTDDLSSYSILAKDTGYYRLNDADQDDGWRKFNANDQILGSVPSTSANVFYYLESKPNYPDSDFPEWLDPNVVLTGSQGGCDINPTSVDFKVKKSAWYRYTYEDVNNNTVNTEWKFVDENNVIGIIQPATQARGPGLSTTIYMLEGTSEEFPIKEYKYTDEDNNEVMDIAFVKIDEHGVETDWAADPTDQQPSDLPSWLNVKIIEDADSNKKLRFYPNQNGLYKWDTRTIWEQKQASSTTELLESGITDDTYIYYMSSTPEYPISGNIYDKVSVVVNKNVQTSNPESISIFIKEAGYYKSKNISDWKYYDVDDELCESKISETTEIYYLTASQEELTDIVISVVPRWWAL